MNAPLLTNFVILFGLGIGVIFACQRFRIPTVVGLLLTGVLVGPHGLGFIQALEQVQTLADIGVILLLFTLGIEFSLAHLLRIKTIALGGGTLQLVLTALAGALLPWLAGRLPGEAVFIGFLVALSSTAIPLKLLQQRGEVASPHGRISLGISIFQDIASLPMMMVVPLLAGQAMEIGDSLWQGTVAGFVLIGLLLLGARWLIPQVLYQIARTRDRELFMLSVIFIGLAIAWLTANVGLSLALGAFLAGLIISESQYSERALAGILPFRDVFTSLFFVSVGMLLDVRVVLQQPLLIAGLTAGLMALKIFTGGLSVFLLGFPLRTAVLVGFLLSQVGEFSFILSKTGLEYGFLPGSLYQLFLAVSVLTMIATPFMFILGNKVASMASGLPLPQRLKIGPPAQILELKGQEWADHLIIIGFGVTGRNMARAATAAQIPYVIVEMNPQTVQQERSHGQPIYYGDATQEAVLEHVGLHAARAMVVSISDAAATRRVVAEARALNPTVHLVVRTQYLNEIPDLLQLGVDEVIPDEFEASVQMFTRVLKKYLIPRDQIEKFVAEVRADGYQFLRTPQSEEALLEGWNRHLPEVEISALQMKECSPLVGQTLAQATLRQSYGVTVLAVRRGEQTLANPGADLRLESDDTLIVMGPPDRIVAVAELCEEGSA